MTDDQMRDDLHRWQDLFQELGALHGAIDAEVGKLRQRVISLEASDQRIHGMLEDLEERLGQVLSDKTQARADLQGEGHLIHLGLSSDYHSLVVQWMQRVARRVVGHRSRSRLEYDLGLRVGDFCEHLFRGAEPDVTGLMSSLDDAGPTVRGLAESMCDRACSLRRKISEIGAHHEWDFRSEISGMIDERRQEAWLTCDPSDPICLVVAPAYVVQGVVYGKQLVATCPDESDTEKG
jgi:hypothetical protein